MTGSKSDWQTDGKQNPEANNTGLDESPDGREGRTGPHEDQPDTAGDHPGSNREPDTAGGHPSSNRDRPDGERNHEEETPVGSDQPVSEAAAQIETTYTARFAGFIVLFAVLIAAGLFTFLPAALAAAGLLIVFLIAGLVQTPPRPQSELTAVYEVTPEHPRPADTVTVEVTITNRGANTYTDLRVVDTVPDELEVVDGVPRRAGTLRPGESLTMSYAVVARRGEYTFGPVVARTRTLLGSMWVQQPLPADDAGSMRCAVRADDIPLEEQAAHYIGDLLSTVGGSGIEFYATREYHRGDPPSQINWRELAKRGELSTITYRERQAADITIICDAREATRFSAGPGQPSGAMLDTYATYQLLAALVDRGHYVGVAIPGLSSTAREESNPFPCRRIDHGRGDEQQRLAFDLFSVVDQLERSSADDASDDPFDSVTDTAVEEFSRTVTGWTNPNTQYIYVTPLLDEQSYTLCRQLRNRDVPVIVISPDVTRAQGGSMAISGTDPASGTVASVPRQTVQIQRATRVESLRQQGLTVIDWDPSKPLAVCCEQQTLPGE